MESPGRTRTTVKQGGSPTVRISDGILQKEEVPEASLPVGMEILVSQLCPLAEYLPVPPVHASSTATTVTTLITSSPAGESSSRILILDLKAWRHRNRGMDL